MISFCIGLLLSIMSCVIFYIGYQDSLKDYTLTYDKITATVTDIKSTVKIDPNITPIKLGDRRVYQVAVTYSYTHNDINRTGTFYNFGSTSEETYTQVQSEEKDLQKTYAIGNTFDLYVNKTNGNDITLNGYHTMKNSYYAVAGCILCSSLCIMSLELF